MAALRLPGDFNDLCRYRDTLALARRVDQRQLVVTAGERAEIPLWSKPIGNARNVGIAAGDDHVLYAVYSREVGAQDRAFSLTGNRDERDLGVCLAPTGGAIAFTHNGKALAAIMRPRPTVEIVDLRSGEIVRQINDPAWSTSGLLGVREGWVLIWRHPEGGSRASVTVDGLTLEYPVGDGAWKAGQGSDPSALLLTNGLRAGTVALGEAREVRCVTLQDGRAAVSARMEGADWHVHLEVLDRVPERLSEPVVVPEFPPAPSLAIVLSGSTADRYGLTWVAGRDGRGADPSPGDANKIGCLYTIGQNDPKAVRAVCRQYGYAAWVYRDGPVITPAEISTAMAQLSGVPIVWLPRAYPGDDLETSLRNLVGHPTVGVTVPFFTANGAWSMADVLAAQVRAHAAIRKHSLDVAWCFDYDRADGIKAHPELQESYARLQASAKGDPNHIPGVVRQSPQPTPQPAPAPPPAGVPMSDRIASQETVLPGTIRRSKTQRYHLMLQHDGNLTLNEGTVEHWDRAVYASGTNVANCALMVSGDGRIVVLNLNDPTRNVYLTPPTESGAYLHIKDDGRAVLMSADGSRELFMLGDPSYTVVIPDAPAAPPVENTPRPAPGPSSLEWYTGRETPLGPGYTRQHFPFMHVHRDRWDAYLDRLQGWGVRHTVTWLGGQVWGLDPGAGPEENAWTVEFGIPFGITAGRWDLTKRNPAYFERATQWLQACAARGILNVLVPLDRYTGLDKAEPDSRLGPYRDNIQNHHWDASDWYSERLPDLGLTNLIVWSMDAVRAAGVPVVWVPGNECKGKEYHRKFADLVLSLDPQADIMVNRQNDLPGHYDEHLQESRRFHRVEFHGNTVKHKGYAASWDYQHPEESAPERLSWRAMQTQSRVGYSPERCLFSTDGGRRSSPTGDFAATGYDYEGWKSFILAAAVPLRQFTHQSSLKLDGPNGETEELHLMDYEDEFMRWLAAALR